MSVLSIGIGIGISTSAYAMIDRLMHPLTPYPRVDELFRIGAYGSNARNGPTSGELFDMWPRAGGFTAVTLEAYAGGGLADANGVVDPRRFNFVAPNYFDVVGVQPRLGRLFRKDERPGQSAVIVSDAFWRTHFNNRTDIGDATVSFAGHLYTIVGVMPPRFDINPVPVDAWLPFASDGAMHASRFSYLVIRARPGLTGPTLQAKLNNVAQTATRQFARAGASISFAARPLRPDVLELSGYQRAMIGAALGILIICCANVSSLTLARGVSRQRDTALRLSLGATRAILIQDVVAEIAVVTALGSLAGVLAAVWGFSALAASAPPEMSSLGLADPSWSWRVLAGAVGAALVCAALAGILPAVQAARVDPAEPLKERSGTTTGRAGTRFRVLVIAELALSMILLSGASLVGRSTAHVAHYDFGYNAEGLLEVFVRANASARAAIASALRTTDDLLPVIDRLRSIDGVSSVTSTSFAIPDSDLVVSEDAASGTPPLRLLAYRTIDLDFARTLGLRFAAGRDVNAADRAGGAVILDEDAARALFPHGDAVGRMIKLGDQTSARPWVPVVGVVRHTTFNFHEDPDDRGDPAVFAYLPGDRLGYWRLIVRQSGGSQTTQFAIQRHIHDALGSYGYVGVSPLVANYEAMLRGRYFVAGVFALLGAVSLTLAAAGLFSVLAFAVAQRMREFAVRIALGARPIDVMGLVLRDGIELALFGAAIGPIGGMWAGSLLSRALYDVSPTDVTAIVSAEVIMIVVTVLASAVPALRAMRADPLEVLRAT